MGLLLSILVFSVGVLETLACVRHIHQGILPAWAPHHVTTASGRRLLREHWRKSTSQDDGSGEGFGAPREGPLVNGVSSRHRHVECQGSREEDLGGRPRVPSLTLCDSSLHHVRSPDIHWPEPVPHSPIKNVEHALPSPVEEVPGDAPSWPTEVPPEPALLQRRRTSSTETLPHEEQGQAKPLRDSTPDPSYAREAREPHRHKPAKTSSFEEARFEPFAPPETKAPEVINVSYSDVSSAGPRAAVVGRIEIKTSKEGFEDDSPALWPIVNIDTMVTPDDEGDVTPPSNLGSRRVSFDPVPTVVLIDNEKTIAEEKEKGAILAPSIKITDDLEGVLRKELPALIEEIIQEAYLKANNVLDARQNSAFSGVSLMLASLAEKADKVINGPLVNESAAEYENHFESRTDSVAKKNRKQNSQAIPQSQMGVNVDDSRETSEDDVRLSDNKRDISTPFKSSEHEVEPLGVSANESLDSVSVGNNISSTLIPIDSRPVQESPKISAIVADASRSSHDTTKKPIETTLLANEIETRNEENQRTDEQESKTPEEPKEERRIEPRGLESAHIDEEPITAVGEEIPEREAPATLSPPVQLDAASSVDVTLLSDSNVPTPVSESTSSHRVTSKPIPTDTAVHPTSPDIPTAVNEPHHIPAASHTQTAPLTTIPSAVPAATSNVPADLASPNVSVPTASQTASAAPVISKAGPPSPSIPAPDAPPTSVSPTSVSPTSVPPTSVPPTSVPPTSVPPTSVPPTSVPPTSVPPTSVPPTSVPPTFAPPTFSPPTSAPPTSAPPTSAPPTSAPPTSAPPTSAPPTSAPPTSAPPTSAPPTSAPPTPAPPTPAPPTPAPTTPKGSAAQVQAKVEESTSGSSVPSSARSPAGGRPIAPVAAPAAPQPGAFWVSDASSSPQGPAKVPFKVAASPGPGALTASRKGPFSGAVPKSPFVPQVPLTPTTSKTPTTAVLKSSTAFPKSQAPISPTTTKTAPTPSVRNSSPIPSPESQAPLSPTTPKTASTPAVPNSSSIAFVQSQSPARFPKSAITSPFLKSAPSPTPSPKTPSSPIFPQKQLKPVAFKSPFAPKSPSPSIFGPQPSPSFLNKTSNTPKTTSVAPKAPVAITPSSSSFASSFSEPSTVAASTPVSDPDPTPSKTIVQSDPSQSKDRPSTPAPGDSKPSSPAPQSSRPSSPPVSRDPQEVVRRIAEVRRANPTVASEVLLSILGFKFPGS